MKVLVVTFGTRGDVQPMLALSLGLRASGEQVVGDVNHAALFARCAVVVHHGGAGGGGDRRWARGGAGGGGDYSRDVIHALTLVSSTAIGTAPAPSTVSWKPARSKRLPSAASASARSRRISSWPSL